MSLTRTIHLLLNLLVASVWVVNGLLCKVLGFVPRHQEIVARILGDSHAEFLTLAIGVAEVLMAIWIGLAIFWTVRLGVQFFGYSSVLWRGKTFETIVHILFSILSRGWQQAILGT